MPEHRLPLQPVWHKSVRHESRNARSFAQRLYHFLNASALTAVSPRTLTIAILALATWLATPTTAQAQSKCIVGQFIFPGGTCLYTDNDGVDSYFYNRGTGRFGSGCFGPGNAYILNTVYGCEFRNQLSRNGFTAAPLPDPNDRRWRIEAIPNHPEFAGTVSDQTYDEDRPIIPLTLPVASGDAPRTYDLRIKDDNDPDRELDPQLPTGLAFDKDMRVLSGTPTKTESHTMIYSVRTGSSPFLSTSLEFTITVGNPPSFSSTEANQAYPLNQDIGDIPPLTEATGGTDPLTYDLRIKDDADPERELDPQLPAGLRFNGAADSRVLAGIPTARGRYNMVYSATDSADFTTTAPLEFMITVLAPVFPPTPTIDPQTYTAGHAISAFALPVAMDGANPVRYSLTIQGQSKLPNGLTFNSDANSRFLSGTPTTPGTHNMIYTATDVHGETATQDFTITISAAPSFSETVNNQAFGRSQSFSVTLPGATGGTGLLRYTLSFGTPFPAGFHFSGQTFSGTISTDGNYNLSYTATDSNGAVVTLTFGIEVRFDRPDPISLNFSSTVVPQTYTVGQDIGNITLPTATGGSGDIRYELAIQGESRLPDDPPPLPGGLAFNNAADTLALSGIPRVARSYNMIYTATDENGFPGTQLFTITINPAFGFAREEFEVPTLVAGQAISQPITIPAASGGSGGNVSYTISTLPANLSLSDDKRSITGTPAQSQDKTEYIYTATDDDSSATATLRVSITINPAFGFAQETFDVPTLTAQQAISQPITIPAASGGSGGNVSYTISTLPANLSLSDDKRSITGTPAQSQDKTEYIYTATDDDTGVTATLRVSITINPALGFAQETFDVPTLTAEQAISQPITIPAASGGSGGNVSYTISTLPANLSLSDDKRSITGTPAQSQDKTEYIYTATDDSTGVTATLRVSITINPAFGFAQETFDVPTLTAQQAISQPITIPAASGGSGGNVSYTISTLPANLSLSDDKRSITGTPAQSQDKTEYIYTATDDDTGVTATLRVSITINPAFGFAQETFDVPTLTAQQAISQPITIPAASGGSGGNVSYTISTLPANLSLSDDKRSITGTPAQSQDKTEYTYTATDDSTGVTATLRVSITINPAFGFAQETFDVPTLTAQQAISQPITIPAASGGSGGNVSYTISTLPANLSLSDDKRSITGTPAQSQDQTEYIYTATDDDSSTTATLRVSITINPAFGFAQETFDVPTLTAEQAISQPITIPAASGGSGGNVSYTISTLPANLSLSDDKRSITGTPAQSQDKTEYIYTATDDDTGVTATLRVSITINPAFGFAQETFDVPTLTAERAISQPITIPAASGGSGGNVSYTISTLPANLSLSDDKRSITGTPAQSQDKTEYIYTATDDDTGVTATLRVSITINPAFGFAQETFDVPTLTAERAISQPITILAASGGSGGNVSYTISTLPANLSLSDDKRSITGTPAQSQDKTEYIYTATDDDTGVTATLRVSITVNAATAGLAFAQETFDVPTLTAEQAISQPITIPAASGGSGGNVSYTISTLPANLSLSDDKRSITGTPAQSQDKTEYIYTATDDDTGVTATLRVSITINPAFGFAQETFDVPTLTAEQAISQPITIPAASGGSGGNVSYTISTLPANLSLSDDKRSITGTPAQSQDQTEYIYTATDDSTSATATLRVSITINPAFGFAQETFDVPTLTAEQAISQPITIPAASGGSGGNVSYTISTLPANLSLSDDKRSITGTPAQSQDKTEYIYTATDDDTGVTATLRVSITINPAFGFAQETFDVPTLTAEQAISQPITIPAASGGSGGNVSYTISTLPANLSLSDDKRSITGTPAQSQDKTEYIYTATDDDTGVTATLRVSITINPAFGFAQETFDVPTLTAEQAISQPITIPAASGGSGGNVSYTISTLPANLSLSDDKRSITGTPAQSQDQTEYIYTATDDDSSATATLRVSITINPAFGFAQETFDVPTLTAQQAISQPITIPAASGGSGGNVSYTISTLPANLSLSDDKRSITGTPAQSQDKTEYTYTATDDSTGVTATLRVSITINPAFGFAQETFDVPTLTAQQAISQPITIPAASGGSGGNVSYTISTLPANLSLSDDKRSITGTPAQSQDQTEYIYTATDDDSSTTATLRVSITINPAFGFAQETFDVPTLTAEQAISQPITIPAASGGSGGNVSYTISTLPANLSLSDDKRSITGTPAQSQDKTEYIYTATDDDTGATATLRVSITINPAFGFAQETFDVPTLTAERAISQPITIPAASGGSGGNVSYTISTLPANLSLSDDKRSITGTPAQSQDKTEYTYTATDDDSSATATLRVSITINPAFGFAQETFDVPTLTAERAISQPITILAASGGSGGNVSYTISTLPANLSLSDDKRSITGTPAQSQDKTEYIYTATDDDTGVTATLRVSITVNAATAGLAFAQETFDVPTLTAEQAISQPITIPAASGGSGGNVSYTISTLPANLSLSDDKRSITGTPAQSQDKTEYIYTATDDDTGVTATLRVSITINPAFGFAQETFDVPTLTAEQAISQPITIPAASGGSGGNVSYTISTLPANLSLSDDKRSITGTPAQSQDQTEYIYTATDDSTSATATLRVSITINPAFGFAQETFDVPTLTAEQAISQPITIPAASGGSGGNVSYTISTLPANLSLSDDKRSITGTPAQSQDQTEYIYTATDDDSSATATLRVSITINPAFGFAQETFDVPTLTAQQAISQPITIPAASGGSGGNVSYTISTLPANLSLSDDKRSITGTPAQSQDQTEYIYTATDDDTGATATLRVYITVNPALGFAQETFDVPALTAGQEITTPITLPVASGGSGSGITYTLEHPDGLPAGLTFNANSQSISGMPSQEQTRTEYTYTATDSDTGDTATLRVYITIVVPSRQEDRLERVNRATLSQAAQVMAANTAASVVARIESLASGDGRASVQFAGQSSLHQALKSSEKLPNSGTLALEKLLDDSSFLLPLTATDADGSAGPGTVAVWGSGDYLKFSGGKDETMNWDGDMISAHLGVDKRFRSNILAGLAASWYKGRLDYSDSTDAEAVSGKQENQMVVLHPYVGWTSSGGVSLWATLGYGWGDLDIVEASQDKRTSDSTLQTAAVGMGGNLLSSEDLIAGGTTTLRLKGDASYAKIKVKDNDAIRGLAVAVRRLRLSLEGSHEQRLASGARLEPSVVVGVRHDSGDSETGTGIELGGGLRYIAPAAGLSLTGRGHVLVNGPGNYEEWGANLQFLLDPGIVHQGLSLNLRSLYGEMPSERLWDRDLTQVSAATINNINNKVLGHLDMEIGYGLAAPVGPALWTPYSGLMLSSDGKRGYRLGGRFELGPLFELRLEGDRQEGTDSAQHGILLEGQLRF